MNTTDDGQRGSNGVAPGAEPGREARLAQALEEYRGLLEAGAAPDRAAFLARHPEMAEELAECLSGLEFVHAVAPALSGAAAENASAENLGAGLRLGAPLGDFRLIRELGRGGMGVVYEAEQISLGRRVALKVLPFASTLDAKQLQRFHNEARAAAGLHHAHIVPVHGVGSERGVHYYAMQFIDGQTLADLIQQRRRGAAPAEPTGPYTPTLAAADTPPAGRSTQALLRDPAHFRTVAHLGVQAAEALEHAHQLGVVHRDVKPANLLVDDRGHLWVTDFGLAHCQSQAGLTISGDLVGTLRYMSPEQALAKRGLVDHRTDVYSLGVTLYELLTLEPAVPGNDRQELLRLIASEDPKLPRRLNRAVPAELETVVLKAMEKAPQDRYGTAQELADDLRRWLDDRPIRARRPSWARVASRWARRHRPLVGAAAVVLLLAAVLGGGTGVWWAQKRAGAESEARAALREAAGLLEEERWPEALSAARHAEGALAGVGADPDLLRQAHTLVEDLEMARRLQEARLLGAAAVKDRHFDYEGPDAAYAAAFGPYGLDVDGLDPQAAAARVRARPIHRQLVAALDDWAYARKRLNAGGWRQRLALARAADPDRWRNRLRDFLEDEDPRALEEAAAADHADDWPALTLGLLAKFAQRTASAERVVPLLGRAQQRHPGDFWINESLGQLLDELRPARLEESIRYHSVAVALQPKSPGAHLNLGNALGKKGRPEEAIAEYREAIRLKEDYAEAHANLGRTLEAKGQLDEAIAEYREAVRIKQDFPEAHFSLGNALIAMGQLEGAIAEYREALRFKKDFPEAHTNLGTALRAMGQLEGAIAEYREAIHLKEDYAEAHANLGAALAAKSQLDEAIAEYREALRINKDFPQAYIAHTNLGTALRAMGQLDEAIAEFREAIRLQKDSVEAHISLGETLRRKGQLEEAIAEFREAIRLKKDDDQAHNNLGNALKDKGQVDEAIAEFREAIRIKKDYADAHFNLGNALRAMGQVDEAIAEYREALRIDKDDADAHNNLGATLCDDKGDYDGAIAEFREAIRLRKDDALAHTNLRNALRAKGQLDEAIAEYRAALRLKRDSPKAHNSLGNALKDKGQLDEAIAEYRAAIRLKKDYAEGHNGLGAALRDKGQLDEAIAEYREAVRIKQDYPEAHLNLGNALLGKDLLDEAIAEYREAVRLKQDYAEAHCNLGQVLQAQGQFAEAVAELKRGHELGSRRPGWRNPSAQWVRHAERLAELDARLPQLLKGEAQPVDTAERLTLAALCQLPAKKLYAASARWYCEAFAAQPAPAEDLSSGNRYSAACAAALAGCGQGQDAGSLDDKEHARLRKQALDWLRADLGAWRRLLEKGPAQNRPAIDRQLAHWLEDTDFAGVRAEPALARLPTAERGDWQKLWQEVEALRQRAARPPDKAASSRP
jgi:tetratricopeptide (TPR) repeat protein